MCGFFLTFEVKVLAFIKFQTFPLPVRVSAGKRSWGNLRRGKKETC